MAFSLAVVAFGGFEASAPLAEETHNPRRNVPIAVIGSVLISGVIYVLGSYALVIAFGTGHTGALSADANPFHTAAWAFIPIAAPLITWVFLFSVTSSYIAANTQTSRVIYAGARGGLWPKDLAATRPGSALRRPPRSRSSRHHRHRRRVDDVTDPGTTVGFLATYGVLGVVIMYLGANIALVVNWARLRRRGERKSFWLWVVVPLIGIVVLAIPLWGDLRPGQPSPYNILPWLTLGLIAVGIIYQYVLGKLRPDALANAPGPPRRRARRDRLTPGPWPPSAVGATREPARSAG